MDYAEFFAAAEAAGLEFIDYRGKWVHPRGRKWRRREIEDIKGLVVHQTAGGDSVDLLGRYHTGQLPGGVHIGDGKGLPGIAYTMFVNKKGELYLVNDLEDITWSHGTRKLPGDENKLYMGVCFGGRFRAKGWDKGTERPTKEQVQVFHKLWAFVKAHFEFTDLDLYGHYDFGKPTCPGDDLKTLVEQYNAKVRHELGTIQGRQQALTDLGYELGRVDGLWGRKSRNAMHAFQKAQGLPVTADWTKLTSHEAYRELARQKEARPIDPPA